MTYRNRDKSIMFAGLIAGTLLALNDPTPAGGPEGPPPAIKPRVVDPADFDNDKFRPRTIDPADLDHDWLDEPRGFDWDLFFDLMHERPDLAVDYFVLWHRLND